MLKLTASHLRCERRGRLLFRNLTFTVCPGEIIRVCGANGAGKTTLLRMLAGLDTQFRGEIAPAPASRMPHTFYLGHRNAIKPALTPVANLAWWQGLRGRATLPAIHAALHAVALAQEEIHTPCHALSAGQCRRVALARLWLEPVPSLWLLDEPFTALDQHICKVLGKKMVTHAARGGVVIFSAHKPPELPGYTRACSRSRAAETLSLHKCVPSGRLSF